MVKKCTYLQIRTTMHATMTKYNVTTLYSKNIFGNRTQLGIPWIRVPSFDSYKCSPIIRFTSYSFIVFIQTG